MILGCINIKNMNVIIPSQIKASFFFFKVITIAPLNCANYYAWNDVLILGANCGLVVTRVYLLFSCDYEHCYVPLKYMHLHKTIVSDEHVHHKLHK